MRPCARRHRDPAATAAVCPLCRLYVTRADYRALWGAAPKRKMTFAEAAALRRH